MPKGRARVPRVSKKQMKEYKAAVACAEDLATADDEDLELATRASRMIYSKTKTAVAPGVVKEENDYNAEAVKKALRNPSDGPGQPKTYVVPRTRYCPILGHPVLVDEDDNEIGLDEVHKVAKKVLSEEQFEEEYQKARAFCLTESYDPEDYDNFDEEDIEEYNRAHPNPMLQGVVSTQEKLVKSESAYAVKPGGVPEDISADAVEQSIPGWSDVDLSQLTFEDTSQTALESQPLPKSADTLQAPSATKATSVPTLKWPSGSKKKKGKKKNAPSKPKPTLEPTSASPEKLEVSPTPTSPPEATSPLESTVALESTPTPEQKPALEPPTPANPTSPPRPTITLTAPTPPRHQPVSESEPSLRTIPTTKPEPLPPFKFPRSPWLDEEPRKALESDTEFDTTQLTAASIPTSPPPGPESPTTIPGEVDEDWQPDPGAIAIMNAAASAMNTARDAFDFVPATPSPITSPPTTFHEADAPSPTSLLRAARTETLLTSLATPRTLYHISDSAGVVRTTRPEETTFAISSCIPGSSRFPEYTQREVDLLDRIMENSRTARREGYEGYMACLKLRAGRRTRGG
ncbi:unnamed protein product [Zymoseptoria tritici ST99CH_3D1]|nr:unnamed protein product [Zymoseptoria tritici ST99CH_3D1]